MQDACWVCCSQTLLTMNAFCVAICEVLIAAVSSRALCSRLRSCCTSPCAALSQSFAKTWVGLPLVWLRRLLTRMGTAGQWAPSLLPGQLIQINSTQSPVPPQKMKRNCCPH